jgi:hypothetical protein
MDGEAVIPLGGEDADGSGIVVIVVDAEYRGHSVS